jgi:MFS family permease
VKSIMATFANWLDATLIDLGRQFRWSYLPPLMVYFAAGVSGLTSVVGAFFMKDYLGLSAAFLAGLTFWTGIPWTLKMPLGHLVDLIWRWKALLVYLGASLIALSLLIMYGLITQTAAMAEVASVETWFILSALLAPVGYVIQDVVADAMTVEAVPVLDPSGVPYSQDHAKAMHTTMQTLGRFAIISGFVIVAAINIFMFSGVAQLDPAEVAAVYGRIYLIALVIPVLSVTGVILGEIMVYRRKKALIDEGLDQEDVAAALTGRDAPTEPNVWLLGGGLLFAVFTIAVGAGDVPFAQEIVFLGSMAIVVFLISRLLRELPRDQARALVGTAIIIFVFRAIPCPVQARHGSKSMSLASTSSSCRCSASSHPAWLWSAWCFCAR